MLLDGGDFGIRNFFSIRTLPTIALAKMSTSTSLIERSELAFTFLWLLEFAGVERCFECLFGVVESARIRVEVFVGRIS